MDEPTIPILGGRVRMSTFYYTVGYLFGVFMGWVLFA